MHNAKLLYSASVKLLGSAGSFLDFQEINELPNIIMYPIGGLLTLVDVLLTGSCPNTSRYQNQIGGLLTLVDVLLTGSSPNGSIKLAASTIVLVPIESISGAISHPPSLAIGISSAILKSHSTEVCLTTSEFDCIDPLVTYEFIKIVPSMTPHVAIVALYCRKTSFLSLLELELLALELPSPPPDPEQPKPPHPEPLPP
uniref:Uncharacterized protein n=1 Tax=Solanum lycopersicum TaxID=4081 RepID=A0A3Q7JDI1_SOLLC